MEECAASLSWLVNDGMRPVSVIVMDTKTNKVENLSVRNDLETALGEDISEWDADVVCMLYVKDHYDYRVVRIMSWHPCAIKCHAIIG